VDGLTLDPDKRWDLVFLQNANLYADFEQAIERELVKDNSDRAQLNAIAAEAVRPLPEAKTKWLENIIAHRDDFKLSQLKYAAGSLFPASQLEFFEQNADQITGAIDTVNATASPEYIGTFSRLFPLNCSDEGVKQVTDILEGDKALNPLMEKSLKNRRDGNQRCLAISRLLTERNQG
jgi:aminopeptidase N